MIQGEAELDLPPLVHDEAVDLFCERAQAVRPDVTRTAAVEQLCERLDGLPLALELAAARTKLLAPEALLDRLADRLDALKGTRDAEERHMTLQGDDRLVVRPARRGRAGSCSRGSACSAAAARSRRRRPSATPTSTPLASLLDKSLLRRRTGRLGEERYWMLETIREFALERLEAGREADAPPAPRRALPRTRRDRESHRGERRRPSGQRSSGPSRTTSARGARLGASTTIPRSRSGSRSLWSSSGVMNDPLEGASG